MFNSLKKKLNSAIDALNCLEWAAPSDVQAALRTVRDGLLVAGVGERDVERFIHRVLDSLAGRDLMTGHDAARMIQRDLRGALAHVPGARPLFERQRVMSESETFAPRHPAMHERWCLKEFDRVTGRTPLRRQFRQPMMERRIAGPLRLREAGLGEAEMWPVEDRHTGHLDERAINRMIASLRGDDTPGQDPPDIGNPALI